jgi:hypothetical protein
MARVGTTTTTTRDDAMRATMIVSIDPSARRARVVIRRDVGRRDARVAFLGACVARVFGASVAVVTCVCVACVVVGRWTMRRASEVWIDRGVGVRTTARDGMGRGSRGTFVPSDDCGELVVFERVSTTDAWYQMAVTRRGSGEAVTLFDGFRCSGRMIESAMKTARACLE